MEVCASTTDPLSSRNAATNVVPIKLFMQWTSATAFGNFWSILVHAQPVTDEPRIDALTWIAVAPPGDIGLKYETPDRKV